ncbi:MAG TPA: AAA family ATPase, partial [Acidimicrobiales bacterium]|nr:AAA family ATPase [Acidimicrobiales bacterium]
MLVELRVQNLGVIEEVRIELGPGMIALTGETGAGKTLVVEALELLVGGRADSTLVRPGADEALVEGRFTDDEREVILARALAKHGRSRAWVDGRMAPVSSLADAGRTLVDLAGQHAHQSLLDPASQRAALDSFAGIDLAPMKAARDRVAELERRLASLGGDERMRVREMDLLRYQVGEIDAARLREAGEESELEAEEERLANAAALREVAASSLVDLVGDSDPSATSDDASIDGLITRVLRNLPIDGPLGSVRERLVSVQSEVSDLTLDLRQVAEEWYDDPERLSEVRTRRQLLRELRRKYGETLEDVIEFGQQAKKRLAQLASAEEHASKLQGEVEQANSALNLQREAVRSLRREAAPLLAENVERRLQRLAMAKARIEVSVGTTGAGDDFTILLGANP